MEYRVVAELQYSAGDKQITVGFVKTDDGGDIRIVLESTGFDMIRAFGEDDVIEDLNEIAEEIQHRVAILGDPSNPHPMTDVSGQSLHDLAHVIGVRTKETMQLVVWE